MAKSKKDLDKDIMFQKIMPVLADNPFSGVGTRNDTTSGSELSALRGRLAQTAAPSEHPMPKNLMELAVCQHIDDVIHKFNCCPCNRCHTDIAAIALNKLPPAYFFGTPEETEKRAAEIETKPVYDALIKAVLYVRSHPNH